MRNIMIIRKLNISTLNNGIGVLLEFWCEKFAFNISYIYFKD